MKLLRFFCITLVVFFLILGLCAAGVWFGTENPLARVVRWPVSPVLLDSRNTLIHARLSAESEWCLPIPLSEMGDWLPKVLIAVEDKRFRKHSGVDLLALGRATAQNIAARRVVSGASTLTSQLVRLGHPRSRTLWAKVVEFTGAWKLEQHLSKDEILEYYLNRAPFGGPIRGVEAAARMYFGKRAKELSLGEAALLVGLLKGPTAYRPDRNPKAALARRQYIISKVAESTGVAKEMEELALQEPLPVFRPSMPSAAWHFADVAFATLVATNNMESMGLYGAEPDIQYGASLNPVEKKRLADTLHAAPDKNMGGIVRSTLNMQIQALLEQTLREQLQGVGDDITAAGVVVDNATASIVAYVGNSRFDAAKSSQWVDCALAPRSPGSTLKPFVYLAAMEKGAIVPASLLADTPLQLGGDAPRNFDRRFRGPVTVHTALADSLNTPAVRVLRMVGVHNALDKLRAAGFSFLQRSDEDYGDSLVLGAGEVSLVELVRAYTTLANLGYDRPLAVTRPPTLTRATASKELASKTSEPREGSRKQKATQSPRNPVQGTPINSISGAAAMPGGVAAYEADRTGKQLYTQGASFLIAEILNDPGRLPFIEQLRQARESAPVAFKTGTSYGLRDAWTAAYSPAYTVVVWFGKASGKTDIHLLGISLAAPAAVRIVRALSENTEEKTTARRSASDTAGSSSAAQKNSATANLPAYLTDNFVGAGNSAVPAPSSVAPHASGFGRPVALGNISPETVWYIAPHDVAKVRVCALSGAAPSAYCPIKRFAWNLPAVWRTVPCSMHVLREGQITVLWTPDLEDWTRKRFIAEDISRSARIISPLAGATYLITPGIRTQPIALKAEGVTYPVHWYVSGEYVGEQNNAELPLEWMPQPGVHALSLLDAKNRTASTQAEVLDLGAKIEPDDVPLLGK